MIANMKDVRPILAYATPFKRFRFNSKEVTGVILFFAVFFPAMIVAGLCIGHNVDRLTSFQILLLMFFSSVLAFAIAIGAKHLLARWLFWPRDR